MSFFETTEDNGANKILIPFDSVSCVKTCKSGAFGSDSLVQVGNKECIIKGGEAERFYRDYRKWLLEK